jgi:uncharacterized protein (TIRG00374 family)
MTNGDTSDSEDGSSFISMRKAVLFILLAVIVYLVIIFYGQIDSVILAFATIPWWVLPVMLGFSFLNYVIRYVKWQYYLRRIDVNLSHTDSFSVFLAGFTLTTTPGKVGEAIKGVFINEIDGTPVAKTVPVVISERVTDLLAMVVLALLGFTIGFTGGDQLLLLVFVGGAAFVGAIVLGQSGFYQRIVSRLVGFGPLKRFQDSIDTIEDTMIKTLSPRPMALTTAVSVPGWFMECIELWLLLSFITGAGMPTLAMPSLILLLQATFIHSTASAVGALIFTPGGLVGYEAVSMTLLPLIGLTLGGTSAATLIIRFVTLWFSVIVGFLALGIVMRRARYRRERSHQA